MYPGGSVPAGTKTTSKGFFKCLWLTFRWKILLGVFISVTMSATEYFNSYIIYRAIQILSEVNKEGQGDLHPEPNKFKRYKGVATYLAILVTSKIVMTIVNQAVGF